PAASDDRRLQRRGLERPGRLFVVAPLLTQRTSDRSQLRGSHRYQQIRGSTQGPPSISATWLPSLAPGPSKTGLGHVFACLLWIVVIHLLYGHGGMPPSAPSCLPLYVVRAFRTVGLAI